VLLTGAAGFIGGAIDPVLRDAGHDVVRVDALLPQAHSVRPEVEGLHELDVREAGRWSDLLDGVDVVCHQAALVGAGVTVADLPAYAAHNDLGTAALLAAMADRGVLRLVLASSMVVYGEGRYACVEHGTIAPGPRTLAALRAGRFENPCPTCGRALAWELVEEDARLHPRSSYAASKVAQEHYAAAWARQAAGSVVALRYHNVYGPGMPKDTPYSGVAAIFRSSLERGQAPQVFEDGGQMRDFVHVTDVARANLTSIEAVVDRRDGAFVAYNVCSGSPVSILDVARLVGSGSGLQPEVTGRFRTGDVRHVVASPARAEAELGFIASIGPEEGLPAFATAPLRG
jgi:dTDP-L-rhamnose 4-epimerase